MMLKRSPLFFTLAAGTLAAWGCSQPSNGSRVVFDTPSAVLSVSTASLSSAQIQRLAATCPAACVDRDDDHDEVPDSVDDEDDSKSEDRSVESRDDGEKDDDDDKDGEGHHSHIASCKPCTVARSGDDDERELKEVEDGDGHHSVHVNRARIFSRHGNKLKVATRHGVATIVVDADTVSNGSLHPGAEVSIDGDRDDADHEEDDEGRCVKASHVNVVCPAPAPVPDSCVPPPGTTPVPPSPPSPGAGGGTVADAGTPPAPACFPVGHNCASNAQCCTGYVCVNTMCAPNIN